GKWRRWWPVSDHFLHRSREGLCSRSGSGGVVAAIRGGGWSERNGGVVALAGLGPQDLLERRFLQIRLQHVLRDQELSGLRVRRLRERRRRSRGGGRAGLDDGPRLGGERRERS